MAHGSQDIALRKPPSSFSSCSHLLVVVIPVSREDRSIALLRIESLALPLHVKELDLYRCVDGILQPIVRPKCKDKHILQETPPKKRDWAQSCLPCLLQMSTAAAFNEQSSTRLPASIGYRLSNCALFVCGGLTDTWWGGLITDDYKLNNWLCIQRGSSSFNGQIFFRRVHCCSTCEMRPSGCISAYGVHLEA